MTLSSIKEYVEYGKSVSSADYPAALRWLEVLIGRNGDLNSDENSYLLTRMGAVRARLGDRLGALRDYSEALKVAPDSYQAKYQIAKSIVEDLMDFEKSRELCVNAISQLIDAPFDETDEDFDSLYYISKFKSLLILPK